MSISDGIQYISLQFYNNKTIYKCVLIILSILDPTDQLKVKKRRGKKKRLESAEHRESELEFMAETFLLQLHSLPSVPLREPDINLLYTVVPVKGACLVSSKS